MENSFIYSFSRGLIVLYDRRRMIKDGRRKRGREEGEKKKKISC
jgi:hypothetical protein